MIYEEEDQQAISDAYHEGYQQGQFDEYASRMGNKQAEKKKARMEQQKNCPYCHELNKWHKPFYLAKPDISLRAFSDGSLEIDYSDDGRSAAFFTESSVINYCPVCGRPLNGGSQ